MPDQNDDAIAAAAVDLNEGAKAARKKGAVAAAKQHLSGEQPEGEGDLDATLERIGDNVRQAEAGLDLSEEAHNGAIARMEAMATETEIDSASLISDVRDFLIDQIKCRPKPWSATSRAEQIEVASSCEHAGKELIRKIIEQVAAGGRESVRVLLTKIAIGDDIVITGKVKAFESSAEEQAVHTLHHARGKHVLLTVASLDDYNGQSRPAETMPDEPPLNFEAGPGEHPKDDSDLAGEEQQGEGNEDNE